MTTITSGDWPSTTAMTLRSVGRPRPGTDSCHDAVRVGRPNTAIFWRNQSAAATAPGLPGERSGYSVASSRASPAATEASNVGGSTGAWSATGLVSVARSSAAGNATIRNEARYSRALTGRSSEPRRGRRRRRAEGWRAAIGGL